MVSESFLVHYINFSNFSSLLNCRLQDYSDVPLTEEEENWVRLSFLLIDEGTVWVAKIVRDYLHGHNLELKMFLDNNRKKLEFNCKHDFDADSAKGKKGKKQKKPNANVVTRQINTKPLTHEQFKVLYPDEPEEVSLDTIDLTLLVLFIGILILPPPPCQWYAKTDPPDTDVDKSSDLVRMRQMRNHLYGHIVECTIPTPEFEVHWGKLVKILERLGATTEELDKIKLREFTNEERKRYAKRITTLFTGDMPDADEFAEEKMKEIAENHKPKKAQKKNDKHILSECHTEVVSAVDHTRETEFLWSKKSDMNIRKVLFACGECHRFSVEEPKITEDRQHPLWWRDHCATCKGEIQRTDQSSAEAMEREDAAESTQMDRNPAEAHERDPHRTETLQMDPSPAETSEINPQSINVSVD